MKNIFHYYLCRRLKGGGMEFFMLNLTEMHKNQTYRMLMKHLKKDEKGYNLKFYFADDPKEKEYSMIYNPDSKKPYYVDDGSLSRDTYFESNEELILAPVFDNMTLKDRWDNVRIITVNNMTFNDWKEENR